MPLQRPSHLRRRPITGRAFSQPAELIRTGGTRDDIGVFSETEEPADAVRCATAPPSTGDPRIRMLTDGGVRLDALRIFWLAAEVTVARDPDPAVDGDEGSLGDIIVWSGQRWRASDARIWDGFTEVLAVRQEGQ